MTDVITLNDRNQPNWNYLLKTFVNVCGKCYKKQMKFQYMENKLMEMEKQRIQMFLENEDEEEDTYFDLTELKEHLKTLPPNERHKVKDFERLRNLANGQDPNEGMSEIDMVIRELEEEERENKNQPEPENWTSPQKLLKEQMTIYSKRILLQISATKWGGLGLQYRLPASIFLYKQEGLCPPFCIWNHFVVDSFRCMHFHFVVVYVESVEASNIKFH